MRILVTGAQGFIGHHILQHLTKIFYGEIVVGCQRGVPMGPFDYVVHCGAAAGPWCEPHEIVQDNMHGMLRLCNHAKAWNAKVIFMSSISVYGDIEGDSCIDETTPSVAPNTYGVSKLFGEALLKEMNIPSVTLRLPGVIGPGVRGRNFLPRIARAIRDEREFKINNMVKFFNNLVHVRDLCNTIERLVTKDFDRSSTYVLAALDHTTPEDIVNLFAYTMQRKVSAIWTEPTSSFTINAEFAHMQHIWSPEPILTTLRLFAREILNEPTKTK